MPGEIAVTAQPDVEAAPPEQASADAIEEAALAGEAAPAGEAGFAGEAGLDGEASVLGLATSAGHDGPAGRLAGDAHPRDPWFEPEPGPADPAATSNASAPGSGDARGNRPAEWFLPTGRAALLPESITESWDEEPEPVPNHPGAAGAPPWAAEEHAPIASSPPPWESGPWHGPGGGGPAGWAGANGDSSRSSGMLGLASPGNETVAGQLADGNRGAAGWQAPAAVVAGVVPLVVPGLVMGIIGLRRVGPTGPGRLAYWAAVGLSVAWAVIIAVLVAAGSGSPANGCVSYPAAVRAAYAKAMSEINAAAPAAVQAADLAAAESKANSAAAATGQIPVRAALFRMASDLQQVQADVVQSRPVPADVLTHLRADGAAFPHSCQG